MRRIVPTTLALAVLIASSLAHSGESTRVIDGDTIAHQGERIRIWGLDCDAITTDAGRRARDELARLIDGNRVIIAERKGMSYSRVVARVYVQRTSRAEFFTFDIACWMIAQGVCRESLKYSQGFYRSCRP